MKKVLVTGASGFIGNYVVSELLKSNCRVIATATSEKNIGSKSWFEKVEFIPFDFREFKQEENYFKVFQQPDLLIHLAWEGLPNYKSLFHIEENLFRHYSFLKNLITNGMSDITVAGTCLEYGFQEGMLKEEMVTNPSTSYAVAKDSLRKFLQQLQAIHPFSLKWVRLFYMYGQGQNPGSIFSQLEKAIANKDQVFNMSGGEQIRDYLSVEEVAKNVSSISLQNKISGIINCCSGKPVKLKDMVMELIREKRSNISLNLGFYPYLDYEPMSFWGDNTKLKTIVANEQSYRRI